MSLHARAVRAIAGLVALVLTGATLVLVDVSTQYSLVAGAGRTNALLADSEALQAALADQEISLTAYDQTRSDRFLSPYFNARQRAAAIESRMHRAAALDPWAGPPTRSLLRSTDEWQAWADGQSESIQVAPPGPIQLPTEMSDLFARVHVEQSSFRASVAVQRSNEVRQESRGQTFLLAIAGVAVVAAVSGLFVLGRLLLYGTLRPIGRLNEIASALAAGERVKIPDIRRDDEVGSLARSLAAWDRSVRGRLALSEAMVEVSGEINLREVLESSAKKLRELMGAAMVAFVLQDARGQGQVWIQDTGLGLRDPVPADKAMSEQSQSLSKEALHTRKAVTGDVRTSGWDSPISQEAKGRGLGPAMAVPMLSGGVVVGAVVLVRPGEEPAFDADDIASAEIMVPSLAAAINVSRLFAALREANAGLEQASRHKSEFLATMSHELRTPLNSILGFSQLLTRPEFGELNDRQARYVNHINTSGEHLLTLINDVLDLSKVEAGQLELEPEHLPLRPLLKDCIDRLQPQATAKAIDLRLARCGDGVVLADGRRLRQIVLNLLSNAVKFTPEGGRVSVSARLARGVIRISVTDNGIGIPHRELGRIFEQFTQVASGRSRNSEGTGLGLALSRRLAELMGGDLAVESREGLGSTFSVTLPEAPPGAPAVTLPAA